jgi:hypothetical protein
MNCHEAQKRLAAGEDPFEPALEAHVAECEECALAAVDRIGAEIPREEGEASVQQVEALLRGMEQRLAAEWGLPAWLRSRSTRLRLGFGALAAAGVPLIYAIARPRVDVAVYPEARLVAVAVVLLGLIGVSLWVKLRPLHRPRMPAALSAFLVVVSLAAVALDGALPAAHSLHPASLVGAGADLLPRAVKCLLVGLAIGTPAFLLTAMLDRSNDSWRDVSVLGPTIAGLAGYFALHLHCPIVAPAHLLAGHLSVLLVFLVLHSFTRRRWRAATE